MKKITLSLLLLASFSAALQAQNVGIGTVSPPQLRLHVSSVTDSNLLLLENRNSLGLQQLTSMYFKTGNYYTGAIKTIGTNSASARMGFFTFGTTNINGLSERISILDGGNVGINTTNPTADFDINGTFRVRGNGAAAGKVLTSDANGNATWQSPAAKPDIGFSANLTNGLFLVSNSQVDVTGFTEDFDDGGVFNASNGRFTAPSDGMYQFTYNMNFTETGTDTKYVSIFVERNGGTWLSYYHITPGISSNASSSFTNTFIIKLQQGDYINLSVIRSAASGNELRGGSTANATYFQGYKVY